MNQPADHLGDGTSELPVEHGVIVAPAAPLPWDTMLHPGRTIISADGEVVCDVGSAVSDRGEDEQTAAYIVHAGNAYPKLVKALLWFVSRVDKGEVVSLRTYNEYASILRELGELQ